MGIKDRLNQFIAYLGVPTSHFEKRIGAANGYINSMKRGINVDKLERILTEYPELSRVWLLTGEGEMLVSSQPAERQEESPATIQMQPVDGSDVISRLLDMIREKDAIIMRQAEEIGRLKALAQRES